MSEFWIQTFTGKKFDLLEPTEDMICIEDIAHHLSIENRYHGATKFPYSVGYHSLLVSSKCEEQYKLEGLLHDARETWYKDLATPLKRFLHKEFGISWELEVDDLAAELLYRKFKCTYHWQEAIKVIDLRMARTERNLLLVESPEPWHPTIEYANPYEDIEILNLSAANVEELFLKEFEKYRRDK